MESAAGGFYQDDEADADADAAGDAVDQDDEANDCRLWNLKQ